MSLVLGKNSRRLLEAAQRDRNPRRFFNDLNTAFQQGHITPGEIRVRALFEELIPNGREMVNSWHPNDGAFQGYAMSHLTESASSALHVGAFKALTGNAIYTRVMDQWNSPEFIGDKLVETIPSSQIQEEFPGVGGFGDVSEEIGETEAYPVAGLNESLVRMPKGAKRGFQVLLSKELVFFDRFGAVLKRAEGVAHWLRLNKEKRIIDVVTGVVNNYIRNDKPIDTYQTTGRSVNHLTSNALMDWTALDKAEQQFANMENPDDGELIVTPMKQLLVPNGLKRSAMHIVHATQIRGNTGVSGGVAAVQTHSQSSFNDLEILSSPYISKRTSSSTTWYSGDFKQAFAYMEQWPINVEPLGSSDMSFSNDVVAGWKTSERGSAGVYERMKVQKNTA